ncbi:hypothetical protein CCACVL1_30465 [Corchorus capsularis]|uniref:Aminotransferase-like plant mobile domain-containing protein n=1 Tax=Corchorus capsularis TaxID=210143 RepID=A0A1R3FX29_COCAP|nr:hypothetical protein CCACVL1_30465 [Corchorus capsularis]
MPPQWGGMPLQGRPDGRLCQGKSPTWDGLTRASRPPGVALPGQAAHLGRPCNGCAAPLGRQVHGGPRDGSVIPSFLGHVASRMFMCQMRGVLKCQNKKNICQRLCQLYENLPGKARAMVDRTRLQHLPSTMSGSIDPPLISAFHILGVPISGQLITFDLDFQELQLACMQQLSVDASLLSSKHWERGGVLTESVFSLCGVSRVAETHAIAWIWTMFGTTLFVDKSGNRIRPSPLHELITEGVAEVPTYSWGAATLAYLYRQLGVASRGDYQGLSGCMTLL